MKKYILIILSFLLFTSQVYAGPVIKKSRTNTPSMNVGTSGNSVVMTESGITLSPDQKIYLPLQNNATTPTICWGDSVGGDCDTGFYSQDSDSLNISINASNRYTIQSGRINASNTNGMAVMNEAASTTNPTLIPNRADFNSGMGAATTSQPNIIANSLEIALFDGTAGSGVSVWVLGSMAIGGISLDTLTGVTAALYFASGVSPEGSLTSGGAIYVTSEQMFANNGLGTHSQLTSFNPITGEAQDKKWNVYTGKIVTRNWETGVVTITSGTTVNWKVAQIANQLSEFISGHIQQDIEVPQGQATDFPNVEVNDTTVSVKWQFIKGKKVGRFEWDRKIVKGHFKEIKPGYWLDNMGRFMRKYKRAEAISAFEIDWPALQAKYGDLPPFLKSVIPNPGG